MNLFLILFSAAVLTNASTFIPTPRLRRDVSHLNLSYLPPPSNSFLPPLPPTTQETLPKEVQPSNGYLPPAINEKQAVSTELPAEPTNEYLPPENEISTEAPVVEVKVAEKISEVVPPSNEYLPPTSLGGGEDFAEFPAEPLAKAVQEAAVSENSAEIVAAYTEAVQDTAVLKQDGYHYKASSETASLIPATEYMLPLEEANVEVEGPSNGETATLEEDGYHYRAIKRRF